MDVNLVRPLTITTTRKDCSRYVGPYYVLIRGPLL